MWTVNKKVDTEIKRIRGYTTIICNTSRNADKEAAYLKILQAKGVNGLIIISGVEEFSMKIIDSKKNIPYICIDREPKDKSNTIFISSNHYQGAFDATQNLLKIGCQYPAIALYKRISTASKKSLIGFKDALIKNNLPFNNKSNVITIDQEKNIHQKSTNFLENNEPTPKS